MTVGDHQLKKEKSFILSSLLVTYWNFLGKQVTANFHQLETPQNQQSSCLKKWYFPYDFQGLSTSTLIPNVKNSLRG